MRSNLVRVSALLFGASLVSAQSVSSNCQKALADVVASPDAACLNPGGLLGFVAAGSNSSIVPALNTWLAGICSTAPCTNQSLSAVVTKVFDGCPTELKAFGLSSVTSAEAVTAVQQAYPTVRKVVCLKDDSTGQNCITQTLTNVEKTTGPLSITKIEQLLTNATALTSVPKDAVCNNCMKTAYNIINKDFPSTFPPPANTAISNHCGATFIDGQNPSGISQSASGAIASSPSPSAAPKSGAMPLQAGGALIGLSLSLLVAVATTFAFLA